MPRATFNKISIKYTDLTDLKDKLNKKKNDILNRNKSLLPQLKELRHILIMINNKDKLAHKIKEITKEVRRNRNLIKKIEETLTSLR
jgi:hypothetical protein